MKPIRLLQFTDLHLYRDPAEELRGIATLPALQAAIRHAEQRFPSRDALVLTGDLVQDDAEGYELVREIFGASAQPVLCLPGNHDIPARMRATLKSAPFQIGGTAALGNWRIALLDTYWEGHAGGRLGEKQLKELEEFLKTNPDRYVMLCLHHQPIPMQSRWLDQVGLRDAPALMALIERHANVRAVLWGHVHQALDRFIGTARFMSTPATCAQFLPFSDDFAIDRRPPGYRVIELMPDGSVATEVLWLEDRKEHTQAA